MPCGVCFDASRNGPNCEWLQPNQKLPFTMNTKQSCNSLQANYAGVVLGIICLLEMNQIVYPGLMLLKFKQRIKVLNNKSFLRSWTIELSIFVEAKTSKLFSTSNRWRRKLKLASLLGSRNLLPVFGNGMFWKLKSKELQDL